MFEKLYLEERDTIEKGNYNFLYEEYLILLNKYQKLDYRSNIIMKQGDRQFFKHMETISTEENKNKRFHNILKYADKQGKSLLDKTHTLEDQLEEELAYARELLQEISDTQKEVVFTMGAIGESRSIETGNHVKRVAEYSKLFALFYGMKEEEAELLKEASPMHDIGKIGIPDSILNKPNKLDNKELIVMQSHTELGYEMLKHSKKLILKAAAIVAIEHHEKWDGSGYPNALRATNIHIYGRITAIADVFDALGSDRCYKKAWCDDDIFQLFKDEKGKHFDPDLIDIFFNNLDDFLAIRDKYKDV